MNARKLTFLLLVAPFTGLLIATKVSVWLTGKELLVDVDAIGHFFWVSIVLGLIVIISVRATLGISLLNCLLSGVIVFGLMDLVNLTNVVRLYKENVLAHEFNLAVGFAKLVGGVVFGLWFWFLDPFSSYTPTRTLGRTLRGGGGGWYQ